MFANQSAFPVTNMHLIERQHWFCHQEPSLSCIILCYAMHLLSWVTREQCTYGNEKMDGHIINSTQIKVYFSLKCTGELICMSISIHSSFTFYLLSAVVLECSWKFFHFPLLCMKNWIIINFSFLEKWNSKLILLYNRIFSQFV